MQEGNRVLESLAHQQTISALLAFSELHEQIQNRRSQVLDESAPDWDLFQTERFVLDEVLQLVCERALAITQAEGLIIVLAEGNRLVCRAAAGPMSIERGTQMPESEFLRDCLDSGRIFRCDDCDIDIRVLSDLSLDLGARSTVMVPLRGRRQRIGAIQVFSRIPFAFGDDDVRSLDLFGELILSALKPEDQDRRLSWLAEVADEILRPNPPVAIDSALQFTSAVSEAETSQDLTVAVANPFEDSIRTDGRIDTLSAADSTTSDVLPDVPFLANLNTQPRSRPGLKVLLVLVAAAALFSVGVYWGMHNHRTDPGNAVVAQRTPSAPPVTAPAPAPTLPMPSDNLLESNKLDSEPLQATPASPTMLATLPKVTGVRHWTSQVGSTVVIDMQDQVQYEVHRLASPERIYFDLHDTGLASDLQGRTIDVGDPSLKRVRVAQPIAGVTRVVLDTKDGSNFAVSLESNPYRIVVQLSGSSAVARTEPPTTGRNEAKAALSPIPTRPENDHMGAKAGNFRIVLDAGHGGWDLGTVGRQGLLEKDLVLDVTQRLGKLLQSRLGAQVDYTRTNDTYLPLDDRASFANQARADLFVSVHANYSNLASARGVETYYTNLFAPPGSRESNNQEAGAGPRPALMKMSSADLHDKIDESRRLAASVQRALYARLAANSPAIRNRGIKDSAFVVLTGTTMPSILTEISFVSSPADEKNLQSAAYRQQIAEALYKGIAQYQTTSHRVKMAQVRQSVAQQ